MQFLKQSTAVDVMIGPAVDETDGVTAQTGLTLAGSDQAFLLKHDSGATVDISSGVTMAAITSPSVDGWYALSLTASHTDTCGGLTVVIQDADVCLPIFRHFQVVNANVYDSLMAAATTDYLQVDTIQISGDATAADNCELAYDGTGYGFTGCTMPTTTDVTNGVDLAADQSAATVGTVNALGAQAKLDVNAEVDTALVTTTYAEPGTVPAATASIKDKIGWLCMLARNKITQNSTTQAVRDDGDSTDVASASVTDDGSTTTRGEWS